MPVIWDLCSGLGGWTEAFVQANWTVVRIDNSELVQHVPHTLQLDVNEWMDWGDSLPKPDIIVASPPCVEFSNAYGAPGPKAKREGREFVPSTQLAGSVKAIIDHYKPKWWAVENVVGAISYLTPLYGTHRQIIGPFVIWGTIPFLPLDREFDHKKEAQDVWSSDPLRANKKALIPFEISWALLRCFHEQRTLQDWSI